MLKEVKYIVVHCSATPGERDIGSKEIRKWHLDKGWSDIGYHFVIRRDGTIEEGRKLNVAGAHVQGFNSVSIGICLVGGVNENWIPENNFTKEQFSSLVDKLTSLTEFFPKATVLGHRDLSPDRNRDGKVTPNEWVKACPCFNVIPWWAAVKAPKDDPYV